jgi:hypothetical protein
LVTTAHYQLTQHLAPPKHGFDTNLFIFEFLCPSSSSVDIYVYVLQFCLNVYSRPSLLAEYLSRPSLFTVCLLTSFIFDWISIHVLHYWLNIYHVLHYWLNIYHVLHYSLYVFSRPSFLTGFLFTSFTVGCMSNHVLHFDCLFTSFTLYEYL